MSEVRSLYVWLGAKECRSHCFGGLGSSLASAWIIVSWRLLPRDRYGERGGDEGVKEKDWVDLVVASCCKRQCREAAAVGGKRRK